MSVVRVAWLLVAAVIAGCAAEPAVRRSYDGEVPLDRQILVMVRESTLHRYRPGAPTPLYGTQRMSGDLAQVAHDLAHDYDLRLLDNWPMPSLGVRCFVAAIGLTQTRSVLVTRMASDPRVESVQPVQTFHTLAHNDPYYPLQTSRAALRLDDLHQLATGRSVVIAQIDTGVELEHPELRGQLFEATNFVDAGPYVAEMHGTAVAGIMVAKADNGIGIVGVAPQATLLPLRACWQLARSSSDALCSSFTLAKAIQFALEHGARVLNLSLAGPADPLLQRLVDKAVERGVITIGALDPEAPQTSFPGLSPNVIAVASAETLDAPLQAIVAPGSHILTTAPNASFAFVSGNSFATAHVSGIVALLLERAPGLNANTISALLRRHAGPENAAAHPRMVDACLALASVAGGRECNCCKGAAAPRARRRDGIPPS